MRSQLGATGTRTRRLEPNALAKRESRDAQGWQQRRPLTVRELHAVPAKDGTRRGRPRRIAWTP